MSSHHMTMPDQDRQPVQSLLWPAVATAIALAILIALGFWQLERKAWKDGLLAQIAERTTAAPVNLNRAETEVRDGTGEYLRVTAEGRFLHEKELFLWTPDPTGPGYHVYAPLEVSPGRVVFVNRGFVPESLKDGRKRPETDDTRVVTGLVRAPVEPSLFSPENNVQANVWFWRDLDGMASAAFGVDGAAVLPFFIDAEAEPGQAQSWPRAGTTLLKLPNRHLEYAWTWFGLAATLIAVFAAFVLNRLQSARAD